ncbi:MAG: flavin reductase [Planctomycetota bacterium]
MERRPIPIEEFAVRADHIWREQWLLLTAGDLSAHHFNTMTVGWGSFGHMWEKPFALVAVRPVRYTFGFMEEYASFTLCAFPERYRGALRLLGTKSGRDGDKIAEAGLTVIPSLHVASPGFAEAELIVECRKIYYQDFDPLHFLAPGIEDHYPGKDYHRVYFGEIVAVQGTARFRAAC